MRSIPWIEGAANTLERIVARHDELRATFRMVGGEPKQRIARSRRAGSFSWSTT
jgi:hypothetical protein